MTHNWTQLEQQFPLFAAQVARIATFANKREQSVLRFAWETNPVRAICTPLFLSAFKDAFHLSMFYAEDGDGEHAKDAESIRFVSLCLTDAVADAVRACAPGFLVEARNYAVASDQRLEQAFYTANTLYANRRGSKRTAPSINGAVASMVSTLTAVLVLRAARASGMFAEFHNGDIESTALELRTSYYRINDVQNAIVKGAYQRRPIAFVDGNGRPSNEPFVNLYTPWLSTMFDAALNSREYGMLQIKPPSRTARGPAMTRALNKIIAGHDETRYGVPKSNTRD